MKSLKVKFTLALVITGLATVALVGVTAHLLVEQRFNQMAMDTAFGNFREDVTAYVEEYGSWQLAQQSEQLGSFVSRRRGPPAGFSRPGRLPPESDAGAGFLPPPLPPGAGMVDANGRPGGARSLQAPFRFLLLDPDGVVLTAIAGYQPGERVDSSVYEQARPILIDNQLVALAHPLGQPRLQQDDIERLGVMKEALLYGLMAAVVLALLLGVFFSHRLVHSIQELTRAIRAMNRGELHQQVRVQSNDEVGVLAETFNRMSADLHEAYNELESSNRTVRKQAMELRELSIRDELTQLYNRRYFGEHLTRLYAETVRYEHALTLVIGDLDHFKQINDRFSHAVGDQVLQRIGRLLAEQTRDSDIVARYGGEEFVIAFAETALEEALLLCERLRRRIEQENWTDLVAGLQVTCSMGVCADISLGDYQQMIVAADEKLYQAKHRGRNRVCS